MPARSLGAVAAVEQICLYNRANVFAGGMVLHKLVKTALAVGLMLSIGSSAQAMSSFSAAKRVLPQIYWQLEEEFGQQSTVYCGCPIELSGSAKKPKWSVDLGPCGYEARKNKKRAQHIEVEHIMPAWEFGHQMKCWQKGGREQCGKDKNFKKMEGDLHNLFPSVGEVNGDRGNFQFTNMGAKPTKYGKCQMVIDFKLKLAQPPEEARGLIARAYRYMAQEYGIRLSRPQQRIYENWDRQHPVTAWECRRNELIAVAQGNDNPFVTKHCPLKSK